VAWRKNRREQLIVALVGAPVAPVVRKHHDGPRPHVLAPTGAALPLQECSRTVRRLVLKHAPNLRVVEANLQRGCRDHNICIGIDARIL
jgi:hypothetical protein